MENYYYYMGEAAGFYMLIHVRNTGRGFRRHGRSQIDMMARQEAADWRLDPVCLTAFVLLLLLYFRCPM